MKHAVNNIHFIGLGGSGMSGIAEVLHNLGYTIQFARNAKALGIEVKKLSWIALTLK